MATMATTAEFTDRPEVALQAARPFLESRPVVTNLVATLLEVRAHHPQPGRYWVASSDGQPVGVAFHSPFHFPVAVTPMPDEAADAIVTAAADAGLGLPGVSGYAATAARFAGQWTERHKRPATPADGMRIYELGTLEAPAPVPGQARRAEPADRDLVTRWMADFNASTNGVAATPVDIDAIVGRRVTAGQIWIWDDGGPRSLAGHSNPAGGVVRIGPVYTPPEHRNHGYAGACVAGLSDRLTRAGHRCMLYAELSNPTSNSIYRRMGYRAVAETLRYRFDG